MRRQKVGLAIQQNNPAPHQQSLQSWLATNWMNKQVGPISVEQRLARVGVTTLERLAQLSATEAASLVDHIFDSHTRGTNAAFSITPTQPTLCLICVCVCVAYLLSATLTGCLH